MEKTLMMLVGALIMMMVKFLPVIEETLNDSGFDLESLSQYADIADFSTLFEEFGGFRGGKKTAVQKAYIEFK